MTFEDFAERLRHDFKIYLDPESKMYSGSDLASLLKNDDFLESYFELFELSEQPEHGIYPLFLTDKQTSPEVSDPKPEFYPTKHRIETTRKYAEQFTEEELKLLENIKKAIKKKGEGLLKEYEVKLGEYLKTSHLTGRPPNRLAKALLMLFRLNNKGGRPTHKDFFRTVRFLQLHVEKRKVKWPHRKIADFLAEVNRLTGRPGTDRNKLHEIIKKAPDRAFKTIREETQFKHQARQEFKFFCQDFNIPYFDPF